MHANKSVGMAKKTKQNKKTIKMFNEWQHNTHTQTQIILQWNYYIFIGRVLYLNQFACRKKTNENLTKATTTMWAKCWADFMLLKGYTDWNFKSVI